MVEAPARMVEVVRVEAEMAEMAAMATEATATEVAEMEMEAAAMEDTPDHGASWQHQRHG